MTRTKTKNVQTLAAASGIVIGTSPAMKALHALIARVAPSDIPVFLSGESGTGKEVIASAIHRASTRAEGAFVAVNCGAIPAHLIEAELFGFEKGAFTGADRQHAGYFERAEGGTLFLDEITEMPVELQTRLLRVLESGRFTRVGGTQEMAADVRIVAACNRQPQAAVQAGRLRGDLLYRLAGVPMEIAPLRDRKQDIPQLADSFLAALNVEHGTQKRFSRGSLAWMQTYSWPGNVRELKNLVCRAFIMADEELALDVEAAPAAAPKPKAKVPTGITYQVGTSLDGMLRSAILATIKHCKGNKRQAAAILGCSLHTIHEKLNEYLMSSMDTARPAAAAAH
jgi:DNA-binding NtrC family response regulator